MTGSKMETLPSLYPTAFDTKKVELSISANHSSERYFPVISLNKNYVTFRGSQLHF